MFSFQPSELWILPLHTARLFIWHCLCLLPSLQAPLNLLAKQLARNTRGRELRQRRELNTDLPKFCCLLICCMKAFPSCWWVSLSWKSNHYYFFWDTWELINTFCTQAYKSCDVGFLEQLSGKSSLETVQAWAQVRCWAAHCFQN